MKTKELIAKLHGYFEWDKNIRMEVPGFLSTEEIVEIIKRLEELGELKIRLKNIKMKDYADQALIEELVKA